MFISFLVQYIDYIILSGDYSLSVDGEAGSLENLHNATQLNAMIDKMWADPIFKKHHKVIDALHAVRYCLRDKHCQNNMWEWLFNIMDGLDDGAKCSFAINIFCPMLTPPIKSNDSYEMQSVDRLLQCINDPTRKWAVLEGFSECTYEQTTAVIEQYNQWLKIKSREPLIVNYLELEGNSGDAIHNY